MGRPILQLAGLTEKLKSSSSIATVMKTVGARGQRKGQVAANTGLSCRFSPARCGEDSILFKSMKRPQTPPISEHLISIHSFRTSRFLNHGCDRRMFLRPVNGSLANKRETQCDSQPFVRWESIVLISAQGIERRGR